MRSRALIVLSALMLSLLLPGGVGAKSAASATRAADARVLAYWTPERIANAKFRDFTRNEAGKIVPNAKPGGGGSTVTGASWTGNGAIEQRSGRILFSSGGSDWICSGSVVNDGSTSNSYSIILTAGHCVYDGTDGWSYNFLFMPDFDDNPSYDCATRTLGCWHATRLAANDDFVNGGGFGTNATVRVDYGFARVGLRMGGTAELDAVGSYSIKTTATALSDTQWAFGYPAEGRYKGKDLIYCKGPTIVDPYGADTRGIGCNMNGGSSGGPWLWGTTNPADGSGQLSSVNSYSYSGLTYMFGPKFNTETTTVAGDVADGTPSTNVSIVFTPST
jgi:hypothetical protein